MGSLFLKAIYRVLNISNLRNTGNGKTRHRTRRATVKKFLMRSDAARGYDNRPLFLFKLR
jgi:hypothetical protein